MLRHLLTPTIAALVVTVAQRASAERPYSSVVLLSDDSLTLIADGVESAIPLGCKGVAMLRQGDLVYVACGADGVVVIDVGDPSTARVIERRKVDGEVTDLRLHRGRVEYERTYVLHDETAEPTEGVRALLFPPRRGQSLDLSLGALGMVHAGPAGGGALFFASATYRFQAPLYVSAAVDPIGFGVGRPNRSGVDGGPIGAFNGYLSVGVDSRSVELGFGAGAGTHRGGGRTTLLMLLRGRFGAQNGLHVRWLLGTLYDTDSFRLWMIRGGLRVPLASRWAIDLDVGGSATRDTAHALLGLRYRTSSEGTRSATWVTAAIGAAAVIATPDSGVQPPAGKAAFYVGPAVAGAVDLQF